MFSKVYSVTLNGLEAVLVSVEIDVNTGIPSFDMGGYLSSEVKESRDRVRVAVKNSGIILKPRRITVNLSPADLRKDGTGFDLPIAVGILAANGIIPDAALRDVLIMGELSLDGSIRPVRGVLPAVCAAKERGITRCIVPLDNMNEASVVDGIFVYGTNHLRQTIDFLKGISELPRSDHQSYEKLCEKNNAGGELCFSEIKGQQIAKRAALIAAAGMHNILYIGSPGSGKSIMAKSISTILPDLSFEESLEISKIYSIAGILTQDNKLLTKRPFRSPHHSIGVSALIGGGKIPVPGEITLADKGILFLDELTEFSQAVIESLRQPLEDKKVTISRLQASYTYPAGFMLAAAMNPCKCGNYYDKNICTCSQYEVDKYLRKISRPFWDRFDICVQTTKVLFEDLETEYDNRDVKTSQEMKQDVNKAREFQRERYKGEHFKVNAQLSIPEIKKYCKLEKKEKQLMEKVFSKLNLTARGYHKILKTARTIADLAESGIIRSEHLSEAVMLRSFDAFASDK